MVRKIIIGAVLLSAGACMALVPFIAPSRMPSNESLREEILCDSSFKVFIQGDCVKHPGKYTVDSDCTYGELFERAGVAQIPPSFNLQEKLRFTDAVLIDGEYYLYLVL